MKAKQLRQLSREELEEKLRELRVELARLMGKRARGTLGKESGKVRMVRRDIARVLTVLREKGGSAVEEDR